MGHYNYRISLLFDDIILMLTNPHLSLPAVKSLLIHFEAMSYYKAKATKSHILDMVVDGTTRNRLFLFLCQWAETGIDDLGITLTRNPKNF